MSSGPGSGVAGAQRTSRWPARVCLGLATIAALAAFLLLRAVLDERFAFSNLTDVSTPGAFDDPAAVRPPLELRLPTIDPAFEQTVREAIPMHGETDAQMVPRIVAWAYAQLRTPRGAGTLVSSNEPLSTWTPSAILDQARHGGRFLCDSYARFAVATGQVLGLEARVVWLDGHVAAEFLDRGTGRWIATDPIMPGILIAPDTGATMSFAEAAGRVRAGQSIDVRAVASPWPEVDVPGSLAYLQKTLQRDLLVYVDGQTSVRRNSPALFVDWLAGRAHGVRLASERSSDRAAKRCGLLAAGTVLVVALGAAAWTWPRSGTA